MSEPRRWNLVAEGLVLAVSGGPSVSLQEAEKGIPVIEAEPVLARIKELEAQLKEANEVAEFYAKKSSWSRGEEAFDVCISDSEGWPVSKGGKRARAYLKKWEGK